MSEPKDLIEMKKFKITYYDEIEAETKEEAYDILRKQLESDVACGDVSAFGFEENPDEQR